MVRTTRRKTRKVRGGYGIMEYPDLTGLSESEAKEKGREDGERHSSYTYPSSAEASLGRANGSQEEAYSDAFYKARGAPKINPSLNVVHPKPQPSVTASSSKFQSNDYYDESDIMPMYAQYTPSSSKSSEKSSVEAKKSASSTDGGRRRRKTKKHSKKSRKHRK